jgi:hypothetical protein
VARLANPEGIRDLSLIRASGSTARVLNLALTFERFGDTEEFQQSPLFKCEPLNRALIVKHALRPQEHALFDYPSTHATKIIFPFSATELSLGGTSVLLGETQFEKIFRSLVGDGQPQADLDTDLELLHLLNEVPSFDPFLLREQLRRLEREPARCFFEVSDADVAGMMQFVAKEIEPLTALAFGASGRKIEKLSARLSEKLMLDEGAQLLEPLRTALNMNPAQYREGVFAWKGFLYYKWSLAALKAGNESFARSIAMCRIVGGGAVAKLEVDKLRRAVLSRTNLVLTRTVAAMDDYESAFAALSRGQPGSFRDFLLSAPGRFIALGEAIGVVKHMQSLWGFRFPAGAAPAMDADDALSTLQDFDRMLTGAELTQDENAVELALG